MKMYDKKCIAIVLIITLMFSVLPMSAFAEQADTIEGVRVEGNTWYVSTTEGLLAWNHAANTALATSGSSINLVLEANLDITGVEWTPVGDWGAPYTGTVDGKDYTITGLTITNTTWEDVGFLGDLAEGGIVKNLNLENINIVLNDAADVYVGSIAGYTWDDAVITDCSVAGEMNISTAANERMCVYAGGIAGVVSGNTVSGCSSAATINITGSRQAFVGGIAGGNNSLITDCKNTGDITVYTQSGSGTCACVGGVVGYNEGQIDRCTSTGTLIADGADEYYTGDIQAYPNVYIGGKVLFIGEYITNNGAISQTQPNGGYAYYNNDCLELHNFVYEGDGYTYVNPYDADNTYDAIIYADDDLTVKVFGNNALTYVYNGEGTSDSRVGEGIAAMGDLLILGDGSEGNGTLFITADYGIDCYSDLRIETIELLDITANYDGIYAEYDMELIDSNITVEAGWNGLRSYSSYGGIYIDNTELHGLQSGPVLDISGDVRAISANGMLTIDRNLMLENPAYMVGAVTELYEDENWTYQTVSDSGKAVKTVVIKPSNYIFTEGVYVGGNTIPEVKAEVITSDANVSIQTKQISTAVMNDVKSLAAENDTLNIIGGKDSAVQITAKENGDLVEHFAQPVTVTVPVSKTDLKQVKDTGKLTLALVVTDENGAASLTYVGGKYDAAAGTFRAYTAETGNYVLVEKDDLIKIELTIGQTVADVNDKPVEKDVPSRIVNDRTLVPAAFVLAHMGCNVDWIHDTRTVVVTLPNGTVLNLPVDEEIPGFGAAPIIESGRTLVPIAYIAYAMDAYVLWVEDAQKVVIVK